MTSDLITRLSKLDAPTGANLMRLQWAIMEEQLKPVRALLRAKEASHEPLR